MRTERNGHAELERLLEEAIRLLESTDLHGANEALKKASAEAARRDVTERVECLTGQRVTEANTTVSAAPTPEERPMLGLQQEAEGQAGEQKRQVGGR